MEVPSITSVPKGPLTTDQHRELALATTRGKKVRSAAGVAGFNAWTMGIVTALSVPFAVFNLAGFVVTVGLVVVTYNEFRGRRGLLRYQPVAATRLGWNQLGLLAMISIYCLWRIFTGLTSQNPLAAEMAAHPEYADVLGSLGGFDILYKQLVVIVYGAVTVLSVVIQGLTAYYYFTRRPYVESYLRETPACVLNVQRSMAGTIDSASNS